MCLTFFNDPVLRCTTTLPRLRLTKQLFPGNVFFLFKFCKTQRLILAMFYLSVYVVEHVRLEITINIDHVVFCNLDVLEFEVSIPLTSFFFEWFRYVCL